MTRATLFVALCPFCGDVGEVVYDDGGCDRQFYERWHVECQACGAAGPTHPLERRSALRRSHKVELRHHRVLLRGW